MKRLVRSRFIVTSIASGAALLRYPADAAEFTYKYANGWPPSHPITVRTLQAASRIFEHSNGRLQIQVFAQAILGTNQGIISQARTGAIEFVDAPLGILESTVTVCGLGGLPFAFSGHKQAADATDGPLGKILRAAIAKLNFYVFPRSWDGGFRQITNNTHPIRVPDDMKGLRIRTAPTPTDVKTFSALGAAPTAIDGSEMYSAAQTHIVDGTDLPLPTVLSYKIYEVQKYASITNWAWTGDYLAVNADAWAKLPSTLHDTVERNFDDAALAVRSDMVKLDGTIRTTLEGHGMAINDADIPKFKAKITASGLYGQWRAQYGTEAFGLLEQTVGALT